MHGCKEREDWNGVLRAYIRCLPVLTSSTYPIYSLINPYLRPYHVLPLHKKEGQLERSCISQNYWTTKSVYHKAMPYYVIPRTIGSVHRHQRSSPQSSKQMAHEIAHNWANWWLIKSHQRGDIIAAASLSKSEQRAVRSFAQRLISLFISRMFTTNLWPWCKKFNHKSAWFQQTYFNAPIMLAFL